MNNYFILYPDGQKFCLCYEEMVELMAAGRKKTRGNEYLESMKEKANEMFYALPTTDY